MTDDLQPNKPVWEVLEILRARLQDFGNSLTRIEARGQVIEERLRDIHSDLTDHEARIRTSEQTALTHAHVQTERDLGKVVVELDRVRIRMALWAGGGSILGVAVGALIPVLVAVLR